MVNLINFVLLVWGLVYIITQSSIMAPVRELICGLGVFFEVLIYCPACTGFWVGLTLKFGGYTDQDWLPAGIIGCGLGALWGVYGPENVWKRERGDDDTQEEEDGE